MKAFVTGGGGFLGGRMAQLLVERGDEVVSYSRGDYPALAAAGVRCVSGDIADEPSLRAAMRGSDTVFHVAAKAGVWGPAREYEHTNVEGTRAVIAAARANNCARIVFTSSPSVCFDGRDHVNASNDLPHAQAFLCDYPRTKAAAERLILEANDTTLATCALRPHLVFGPGDPHLLPRLLRRARAGRLRIVGDGANQVSLTYIDNAAWAHLDAADRLEIGAAHAGQAYFVNQREPVRLWSWIGSVLAALRIEEPKRSLSARRAYVAGAACEVVWKLAGKSSEPPLTRFVAAQLASTHTYDLGPACRAFGYVERVSLDEATRRTIAHFSAAGAR
ncbi:MAG: NAD-dependent epimerase/dehydratase family protein [Planctomycetes bacterium]|nr:NAD-dependent epimerase/dehydratase family protein [Planctomycetota bacterium]